MKRTKRVVCLFLIVSLCLSLIPAIDQIPSVKAAVTWTKHTANPVYTEGLLSGSASVIYDSDAELYKMWYTHVTGNLSTLDSFIDGIDALNHGNLFQDLRAINFSNIADNDAAGLKNIFDYLASLSASDLKAIVDGARSTIVYSESVDGINWGPKSTVLETDSGEWDKYYVGAPYVVRNSATSYEMWYTGGQLDFADFITVLDDIAVLSAANLTALMGHLVGLNIPDFIDRLVAIDTDDGSTWLAYLILHIIELIDSANIAIGHATSTDGIVWTKDTGNPVLQGTNEAWDRYGVGAPSIIKDDSGYKMWYTGFGIDYSSLLGLLTAQNIDDIADSILGSAGVSIGYATSSDGTNWTKDTGNPVLRKGSSAAWDEFGAGFSSVIKNGSNYEMWYTGARVVPDTLLGFFRQSINLENALITGANFAIGHATSTNGISWTKDTSNPVVSKGSGAVWDKYGVGAASVIKKGANFEMWYTGVASDAAGLLVDILDGKGFAEALRDSTQMAIGYASTTDKTLQSIAVTPSTASVPVGRTQQFTAIATYSDGSTANITSATGITWRSSNIGIGTINTSTGLATSVVVSPTPTVITATYGGVTSSDATLYVTSAVLESIAVSPSTPSIALGNTSQFTATGTYSDDSSVDLTSAVAWSSSTTTVATIGGAGLATSKAVGTTTISATADSVSGSATLTVTGAEFTVLTITPDSPTVAGGDNITFQALAKYTDDSTTDISANTSWASSNTSVATISSAGFAAGQNAGTTTITATSNLTDGGTATANTTLVITAATLASVDITAPSTSMSAGNTVQLQLIGTYSDSSNATLTTDNATIWASLSPSVATVTSSGLVSGVAVGSVTVRSTNSGVRDTVGLTVTAPTLSTIAVTPGTPTMPTGDTLSFVATGTYSDGSTSAITSTVTWASSNTTIATISTAGLATTIANGSTNITATKGSVSGNTTLTVTSATVTAVTVTPTGRSVAAGRTQQFNATANYSDISTANITTFADWSTDNTAIATISSTGLVTTLASGNVTIIATQGDYSGNTTLEVTAAVLTAIDVSPDSPSVAKGRTQQFVATGTYSDGSTSAITSTVTWASSNTTVATISTAGLATANNTGTTTIQATSGSISDNTTITVTAAALDSVDVTPTSPSVAAGQTQQFSAQGTYSDNSTDNITTSAVWASSSTDVASMSAGGLATTYTVGNTNVTAAKSGKSDNATLTVTAAVLDSITVTPVSPTIRVGDTLQFRAVGTYSDGSKVDLTATASWSSNNTSAATISTAGLARCIAGGAATITATSNGINSSATLTVTAATLTTLTVTPSSPSVAAGRTQQFNATGNFSDGGSANLTTQVTWSSSDNNTARVNTAGLATSYRAGAANITATSGSVSGNTTLTVSAALLESVTVTPVSPSVTFVSGNPSTQQFVVTASNSDGSTTIATTSATWVSSDNSVATIGPNTGLATTVAAGSANITATYGDLSDNTTFTIGADNVAPVVTLSRPIDGLIVSSRSLTVLGSVDDASANTSIILNGAVASANLTLDTNGGFSKGVLLNAGSNTILVKAIDGSGNTGASGTVTVEVDPNKPGITISSPSEGTLTSSSSANISGTITNATSAIMRVNGTAQSVTVTSGSFSASATLTEGKNVIAVTAYATGNADDSDYLGTSGARTIILDTTAPVATVVTPAPGSVVNTSRVQVSGTIDDPYITDATLVLNGLPQSIPVVDGAFSQFVTLSPGANTIKINTTDEAGNASSGSTITVTLDTSMPGVTVTTPTNKLVTNIAGRSVSGSVSDPAITTASLYLNSGSAQTIAVAPDGSFSKVVTLSSGANTIEVRATDAADNIGSSGVINVTLDSTAPQPVLGLSDPVDSLTITVTSNEALASVPTISVNGSSVNMTQVDVNKWRGNYGSSASPITAGDYTVSMTGTDKAGNSKTETASFSKETISVDGIDPTTVTAPSTTLAVETYGAVSDASISVTQDLENPSGNVENPEAAAVAAGTFIDIVVSPELRDNLEQIYMQMDYDQDSLPTGTNESTLKLYLWDTTTGTWQAVTGSGVNTTGNYIYGTVTHLSKYGGFGSLTVTEEAEVAEGGTGYGGAPGFTIVGDIVTTTGRFTKSVETLSADGVWVLSIAKNTIGLKANGRPLYYIAMVKSTSPPAAPDDASVVHEIYDFQPDGVTFSPPANLTIDYDEDDIPDGVAEGNLVVARWDETIGEWVILDTTVDTDENTVTAPVSHFTNFTILAYTRPAAFTVSELTVTPDKINPGEKVTISVSVSNTGDLTGSYELDLMVNDKLVETEEVTLTGGATEGLVFTLTEDKPGSYTVSVDGLSGKFVVKTPAVFSVKDLSITPIEVDIGETVTVSASVTNTGDLTGAYEMTLKINDASVEVKKVTLSSGATQKLTFTIARDEPGSYMVSVDGLSGKFVVREPAPPPPPPSPPPPPPPPPPVTPVTPVNWWLIGGAIAGFLGIVTVVVLVIRRREE